MPALHLMKIGKSLLMHEDAFLLIEFIYTCETLRNRDTPNEFMKRFSKFN